MYKKRNQLKLFFTSFGKDIDTRSQDYIKNYKISIKACLLEFSQT